MKKNESLSLILTLLIIGSILTGTVLVGDTIIRHSRTVKGTEVSEIAYFAAESGLEKASYHVQKNYADISTCELSGTLSSGGSYSVASGGVVIDDTDPNDGNTITNTDPWDVTLSADQSFQLDMDIDGAAYPTSLLIDRVGGSEPSDLIIYSCTTIGSWDCSEVGTPRECSNGSQEFNVSFPYNLSPLSASTTYYKIRINNNGSANETYRLTPGNNTLPIGIDISATGTYSDYERRLKTNFPKWQIFGS
ncbi:hypothetical protein MYX07_04065 [Patescibacteria group bacterium AH-259-L07]|nr:hypothetical protein [Patescibacteria group bacterium AH-259-L07]